jgi:hypothetical protein
MAVVAVLEAVEPMAEKVDRAEQVTWEALVVIQDQISSQAVDQKN